MSAYPASWAYPGEEVNPSLFQTTPKPHPNHTENHPNHTQTTPENHPNHTQTTPENHPNHTQVRSGEDLRLVFDVAALAAVARVGETALRKSWLPYLEEVAPGRIQMGHGQYSRKAMELVVSLRQARDDGMMPKAWVAQQLTSMPSAIDISEAVAAAEANGAIVPVEVLDAVETSSNQLAIAQSQTNLALSLVDAVLSGVHGQQQAYIAQSQALKLEQVKTQAAIDYALELQAVAQVRADMDAKLAAQKQAAIAAQLQKFQGGEQ